MRSYFFFPNLIFYSNMSNNGASEGVTKGIDMKFPMRALTSKVQRMFRAELEQFHEGVEQSFKHPQNPPIRRRRERLPRRGAGVEKEEYDRGGFEDKIDHDLTVSDRRYGGDLEKLGIGKVIIWVVLKCKFHHSKERMTLRHILSGRERWRWCLIVTIILTIRR